jgi:hypothetical protein
MPGFLHSFRLVLPPVVILILVMPVESSRVSRRNSLALPRISFVLVGHSANLLQLGDGQEETEKKKNLQSISRVSTE